MTATRTDRGTVGSLDAAAPAGALPRSGQPAPARWPAELAVVVLTAATVASFWRVFVGWRFLPALLAAAAASHLLAWTCRRFRLPVLAAVPLSVAGLGVYAGLAWYRATTWFGVPTGRTVTALRTDLRGALSQFATAVPPVVAQGGFVVAAAVGVWLIAFLADSLAFRAMAGVEAVLPAALGFTLTSAVGANRLRLPATFLWLLSAMLTVAMLRALRASAAGAWLAGRARSLVAVARWAVLAGIVATLVGVFGGTRVPGYGKSALVSTRNKVPGTAIAVSPFVDLKPRLSSRTPATAFTVKTDGGRSYWRLATLDEFDGRRWQSPTRNYQKVTGPLAATSPPAGGKSTTATITIAGLTNEFVPAAAVPTSITAKRKVAWEPDLQSLILPGGGKLKKGDTFTITSVRPTDVTPDELRASSPQDPPEIADHYLDIPTAARRSVAELAREQTADAPTRYDKMLALQTYFRSQFSYSLNVTAGNGLTAIEAFLQAKQGYCEQFSATFAAMARTLGVPARVAVGFTYGLDKGNGTYLVQDKHAHAWPEIYFEGYGWIPFEPTPGRGNPDAEQITTVLTQQVDEQPAAPRPTSSLVPTPSITIPRIPDRTESSLPAGVPTTAPKQTGPIVPAPVAWTLGIALGVAGVALLWVGTIAKVAARRWRRRRRAADTVPRQVLLSWHRAVDGLERMGARVSSSETASQVAARLGGRPGVRTDAVTRLADLATIAGFSGVDLDPALATEADDLAETVRAASASHLDRRTRWRLRVDPRPLWRPLPGDRHERAGHDLVTTVDRV